MSVIGRSAARRAPTASSSGVDGVITKISDLELAFTGRIETLDRLSDPTGDEPCVREGDTTFLSTQDRQYWRMQWLDNPCYAHTDYVDIYFR